MDIDRRKNCRTPCNLRPSSAVAEAGCTFRNPAVLLSPNCCTDDGDFGVVVAVVVVAAAVDVAAVGGVACTVVVAVVVAAVVESGACSWLNKGWSRKKVVGTSPTIIPRSQSDPNDNYITFYF
jgi:hypothetical protein